MMLIQIHHFILELPITHPFTLRIKATLNPTPMINIHHLRRRNDIPHPTHPLFLLRLIHFHSMSADLIPNVVSVVG